MDKISFPYRSTNHLALLHVIAESGAWEKYGLDVMYDKKISSGEAHEAVPRGDVEFVGGNHISPYAKRASGDPWVYLGQTVNAVNNSLVVRADSDIYSVSDLYEKTVGSSGSHPKLNNWLYLKLRGLDTARDEVALKDQHSFAKDSMDPTVDEDTAPLWQWVLDKKVDAVFLRPPANLIAAEHGLRVIDIEPLPMIYFTTISTSLKFVEQHPDIVERFLKAMIEGVFFFKTQPERSIAVIAERYNREGKLDHAAAAATYHSIAGALEPKLYPTMAAIDNVYQEACHQYADARRVNPLALWDLHPLRKIDDSGFIDELYANAGKVLVAR